MVSLQLGIDIPGLRQIAKADPGLTVDDMAQACWEALDEGGPGEPVILVDVDRLVHHSAYVPPAAESDCGIGAVGTGYSPVARTSVGDE